MGDIIHAKLDSAGRLLVPAELRESLGLKPGGSVVLEVQDGVLRIVSQRQVMREAQAVLRRYVPAGVSLVDELIAERRREAAKEDAGE
jgi:AbrB family looped-hinge helix DNA binding protein